MEIVLFWSIVCNFIFAALAVIFARSWLTERRARIRLDKVVRRFAGILIRKFGLVFNEYEVWRKDYTRPLKVTRRFRRA